MTIPDPQILKQLKKRILEGLFLPLDAGCIIGTTDLGDDDYLWSKKNDGFIHRMPICLHVSQGAGAGNYPEYITKYMSIEEAKVLVMMLNVVIEKFEHLDAKSTESTK